MLYSIQHTVEDGIQRLREGQREVMQRQSLVPSIITHSALISTCENCKQVERALEVVEAVHQQGGVPDVITHIVAD